MTTPYFGTVVCPNFIGRQFDLTALSMLIDRQIGGQGQMVLLGGEAGIGKSRLLAEAKTYATAHNVQVLQGNCFQTDRSFPYAPLLDLFRSYFVTLAPVGVTDTIKPLLSELSHLLPDLPLLFPEIASRPATLATDPEQERRRLFAVLTHFFTEQAAHHPVLLILEDVHWCDDLSLEFLLYLARRASQAPLFLLMTYRSDELHPRLRQWLNQLNRERLTQEFALTRFSRADVAAMLHAILGPSQEVDVDLIDTLYAQSEGNPFFVEELLKSFMTTGELLLVDGIWKRIAQRATVPRSIQEAVQQRVVSLSADARQLLTFAAVAGRNFNITVLQQVMQCEEAHLLTLLKEVMAAQLVSEEAADQFAFRHALTQQAIVAELLLRERQALHRTLAETLEHLSSTPSQRERFLGDLALHCYEGGLWEPALRYEQQVGERALTLYAPRAAIDHLTRAVDAAHHLSQTPPSQVYHARGQAYEMLGDFDLARGDYERALGAAHAAHDDRQEWQSMLALGFLWAGRDYAHAGSWFQQALDQAERLANPVLRAHSLNRLGNWLVNTGRTDEGLRAHQEALSIFEAQADPRGMAETFDLLGTTYGLYGDCINADQQLGQAIALFRTLEDDQGLASSLAMRVIQSSSPSNETTFHALRSYKESLQDAAESLRLARQMDSLSGQAFAEIALAEAYSSLGELGQALTHAQEALRIATTIEHQQWMTVASYVLGDTYLLLLQPALAQPVLDNALELAHSLGSAFLSGTLIALKGLASLMEHDLPGVVALLSPVLSPEQLPGNLAERQIAWVWGELALMQGEAERALQRAEQLLASVPGMQGTQPIPHLLNLKGEALVALGRLEEAVQAFEEAKRGSLLHHKQSFLWRVHRSLGQVYRRLKREEEAQREYRAARQVIEALAASIDETTLREHFLHTALSSLPQGKTPNARQIARQGFNGLTTREREVAILVAQGWTNGEIATHLVLSDRTVETHVSNILGKLDFISRAQIAAWVVAKGLNAL